MAYFLTCQSDQHWSITGVCELWGGMWGLGTQREGYPGWGANLSQDTHTLWTI